jgi:hypothetical protein
MTASSPERPDQEVSAGGAEEPGASRRLEAETIRRIVIRLVPFLTICYLFSFIGRVNAGFAALDMNRDLGLSEAQFGWGGSLFFVSYVALGIPCNLAMVRFGARLWLSLTIHRDRFGGQRHGLCRRAKIFLSRSVHSAPRAALHHGRRRVAPAQSQAGEIQDRPAPVRPRIQVVLPVASADSSDYAVPAISGQPPILFLSPD